MLTKKVNLYEYWKIHQEDGMAGNLTGWYASTPLAVSKKRHKPAVLILPGGGYSHTSDRESEPIALQFVAKGYVAFVLEYSVAPFGFPTSLREAAMAMRYIRENAADFEINPNMIAAIGFSAGGHLCGTLGTMYDCAEVADLGEPKLLRPDVLGLCYPVAVSWGRTNNASFQNLTKGNVFLKERLSLERLVRKDMPPVFLWHTRDDAVVPCRNSLILSVALEEAGVPFSLHIYRHGPHGLATANELAYETWKLPDISWDVPDWFDAELCFFKEIGFKIIDDEETAC